MSDTSKYIPCRIIPCCINMIPFSINLEHIPGMIHGITDNHFILNSHIIQKKIVCKCISLTHCLTFHQRSLGIIYISTQHSIQIISVRISSMQYKIIMKCQYFIQITHPRLDNSKCFIYCIFHIICVRAIDIAAGFCHNRNLDFIKCNCNPILYIAGFKTKPVILRMAVKEQHHHIGYLICRNRKC